MRAVTLIVILFNACICLGQTIPVNPNKTDINNFKQGKWTVWFDENWQPTTELTEVAFYRIVEYKNGKPVGSAVDYFRSGQAQFEGTLLSDDPEDVIDYSKPFRFYNEDGTEDRINTLGSLGNFYESNGRYDLAVANYEEALAEAQNKFGKEDTEYLTVVDNLALLYVETGDYKKAEPLFHELLKALEKDPLTEFYATSLNNFAEFYRVQGNYPKAEPLYVKALEIEGNILGRDHPVYATTLNNLAMLYSLEGNYSKAEKFFIEALYVKKLAFGKDHHEYAVCLGNLAELYLSTGNFDNAEPLLVESLQILEKTIGKENAQYATLLSNLSSVYDFQGKFAEAEKLQLEVLLLNEKMFGKEHPDYAVSLNNVGFHYLLQKQFKKAEPFFIESLRITEKAYGRKHPLYLTGLRNMADLYASQGEYVKAEPYFQESNANVIFQINNYFPSMSEQEKAAFLKQEGQLFDHVYTFAIKRSKLEPAILSLMYDNQLVTKAMLFNSNNAMRKAILNSKNNELTKYYEDWKIKKEYLSKVYGMSQEEKTQRNIHEGELEEEVNDYEKYLSNSSKEFARGLENKKYSWKDVQSKLKPGEAAIEMVRFLWQDEKLSDTVCYAALLITPSSVHPDIVIMKNGKDMEGKYMRYYSNSITGQTDDVNSFAWYWQAIGKHPALTGTKRVYFSPDGVYNTLNLNTLFNTVSGKYLFEELDVQLVSSTKNLIRAPAEPVTIITASLLGYPDYTSAAKQSTFSENRAVLQADSVSRELSRIKAWPLPGTKVEVNNIARLLQGNKIQVTLFTDKQATEDEIKRLKSPQILHIATHGYFLKDGEDMQAKGGHRKPDANPLLRSGLLLAGAQLTIDGRNEVDVEDGILTAYEAMNLDLEKTELVVLSACETGLGAVSNGEGVYGLQRAFQNAGAKAVIMSLWSVSDQVTEELMTGFYANWLKSGNKRQAFKVTQQAIKQKYNLPFYWGAFVIVGE